MTEGSSITLVCPSGKKLGSIVFASYGTPTGSLLDFEAGACDAPTTLEVVAAACFGQPSCTLSASNEAFGDPCLGTFKAMSVEAQCVGATDTLVGGSVGQDQTLTLECPPSQKISLVAFASYGTPKGTPGTYTTGWCDAASSISVVQGLCAGQSSCSIPAGDATFGDPCIGTYKSLSVAVECADVYSVRRLRRS
ncbi:hypothetical protein ACHHYP_06474 [Achlya hypogyna]|uniref:SUEL-type lectin domain-containing protein n=1 Tax=Achlya hypogyna TaxID=1202772 RepID=A0A1V9YTL2_ACHHY|nr:hypothetical protein ACHHYP_06474 [Achlya hypogyna]